MPWVGGTAGNPWRGVALGTRDALAGRLAEGHPHSSSSATRSPSGPAVGLRLGAGEPSTGTTRVREALHRAWRESRHAVSSNPYALYPPSVLPSKGRTASLPFITRPRMLGRAGATRPAPGLATPGMGLGMGGAACRVSASAPSNARPHTGHALWRMSVERLLLLGLAPWLLGLGIQVHHHRTFLAGLAFTLIRLAAFGFHGAPSLPAAAAHAQASGSIAVIVLHI